jgi:hypothetical protein
MKQGRSQLRGSDGLSPSSRTSWRFLWWNVLPIVGSQYAMERFSMTSTFIAGQGYEVKIAGKCRRCGVAGEQQARAWSKEW